MIFILSDDPITYPLVQTPQPSHRGHSILPEDDESDYIGNGRIATPRSVSETDEGKTSLVDRDISTPERTEVEGCDSSLVEQVDFVP